MPRHESVTDEDFAGFLAEVERVKAAPDWDVRTPRTGPRATARRANRRAARKHWYVGSTLGVTEHRSFPLSL
jgi:hypothetical protein